MLNKYFYFIVFFLFAAFCTIYYDLLSGRDIFTHDAIVWFGSFHYYVDSMIRGEFPYWDPYMLTGTLFYPNIHLLGLLDPLTLLSAAFVKYAGISHISAYVLFHLGRLLLFVVGAYFLYEYITKCRISALLSSGILCFSVAPVSFWQNGMINLVFLTPFALYFLLLFLNNTDQLHKLFYLSSLLLVTGITLNIFIPAYFLFNFIVFFIVAVFLGIVSIKTLLTSLKDKKTLVFIIGCFLLLIMISAPSVVLRFKDSSDKGELFASLRVFQKNNAYKKILATEIDDSVLSDKFTDNLGIYNSYGNIMNLIYPDMWKGYFAPGTYMKIEGYVSEMAQYIGIIPFLICIIGFIYSKSRYKYLSLIMMIVISINMISINSGGRWASSNFLQNIFNGVFPPLKMIEVKEPFSSFFLLYLCMLLSLGLKVFFHSYFIKGIGIKITRICADVLVIKFIFSLLVLKVLFFASTVDLIAIYIIISFAVLNYLYTKCHISQKAFYVIVLLIIFLDLFSYNYNISRATLEKKNTSSVFLANKTNGLSDKFEFFRKPVENVPNEGRFTVAFAESIAKSKGIFSNGGNHHVFTTKRYYDFLTHVPLENQLYLSGAVLPVIRFFATEDVKWDTKQNILIDFMQRDKADLVEYLFLEKRGPEEQKEHLAKHSKGLNEFQDVEYLNKTDINNFYFAFKMNNKEKIGEFRKDVGKFLETSDYNIEVQKFSSNMLELSIENNRDGYLYYNDGWSQYWKAFDSQVEIPVLAANYNSKAVFLKKGKHLLQFIFEPVYYRYAIMSYYTGLIITLSMVVFFRFKMFAQPKHSVL